MLLDMDQLIIAFVSLKEYKSDQVVVGVWPPVPIRQDMGHAPKVV